jgi:hypothetical protein
MTFARPGRGCCTERGYLELFALIPNMHSTLVAEVVSLLGLAQFLM